jgi:2-hydroxychromene-2-carboxylate isomerase
MAHPDPNVLATVKRAAAAKRRADARHEAALEAYRAALLDAVDELAADGRTDAFTVVAKAAGITRQALHQLAGREALR